MNLPSGQLISIYNSNQILIVAALLIAIYFLGAITYSWFLGKIDTYSRFHEQNDAGLIVAAIIFWPVVAPIQIPIWLCIIAWEAGIKTQKSKEPK
jgi:hypothetical protein